MVLCPRLIETPREADRQLDLTEQLLNRQRQGRVVAEAGEVDVGSKPIEQRGNGRTVVNNKGNAVKKYEPYFSVTHRYESNKELVESGVTAHDPAKSGGTAHDRVRVLIVPAKDAKGAPTNTMTFEEAPSHPP